VNSSMSWRTVDIVVTAAIAVAFGVVFWAWNALWAAATPAFLAVPPAQNILYGTWLAAGVVAGLVVQKPGAALFAELVAASVSLILGSQWGLDAALSGLFQGAGAELGFAVFRYRRWDLSRRCSPRLSRPSARGSTTRRSTTRSCPSPIRS